MYACCDKESINCGKVLREILSKIDGKGGGSQNWGQAVLKSKENVLEKLKELKE